MKKMCPTYDIRYTKILLETEILKNPWFFNFNHSIQRGRANEKKINFNERISNE
jgi:hypothetical protein